MSTVAKIKRRSKSLKLHNPAMLAVKKACRALGVNWADITAERDRLRDAELEQRDGTETARKAAWSYWLHRSGRAASAEAFWRNGFQRALGRKLANGCDYTAIRFCDEVAQAVRTAAPEYSERSEGEIWELLLSDYKPRTRVENWYELALANVLAGRAVVAQVESTSTPF